MEIDPKVSLGPEDNLVLLANARTSGNVGSCQLQKCFSSSRSIMPENVWYNISYNHSSCTLRVWKTTKPQSKAKYTQNVNVGLQDIKM